MELKKRLRANLDFTLLATVVAGFSAVAAQRLGSVPLPDTGDESMILQVPYEIIYRGKFAWPMYRFLGGNIENAWHSFRPVYYWLMTGFFKLFGWGLTEGRAFNLLAAAISLVLLYLIGRRLFDWQTGLIAVLMVICDPNFVERSRVVRNECVVMVFVLLAYYLYEIAEARKQARFYVAAGLAAGASVMCHTNALYLLAALTALIVLRRGWRFYASGALYQFLGGAFAVMAYEIISDLTDYQNVRLQYHDDKAHFDALSGGLWGNFLSELDRYRSWYSSAELFASVPLVLLHLFQVLMVIALVYLVIVGVRRLRRGNPLNDPRGRVLIVTACAMLFLALATGPRRKYVIYIPYLTPWFALCVGILLRDGWFWIRQWRLSESDRAGAAYRLARIGMVISIAAFGLLLIRQNVKFVNAVRNPNLASFDELKAALREIVPAGVCPASVTRPVMWLAFPEADRCYVSIEGRMEAAVDIDGKDYALITPFEGNPPWSKDLNLTYHKLGEIQNTPYGDLRIYYTGTDAGYRALAPKGYEFFGKWRGHVTDDQVAAAPEVWSVGAATLGQWAAIADPSPSADGVAIQPLGKNVRKDQLIELGAVDLKPDTAYQLAVEARLSDARAELIVLDERSGLALDQLRINAQAGPQHVEKVFRTLEGARVKLAVRPPAKRADGLLRLSRISIRELGSLQP